MFSPPHVYYIFLYFKDTYLFTKMKKKRKNAQMSSIQLYIPSNMPLLKKTTKHFKCVKKSSCIFLWFYYGNINREIAIQTSTRKLRNQQLKHKQFFITQILIRRNGYSVLIKLTRNLAADFRIHEQLQRKKGFTYHITEIALNVAIICCDVWHASNSFLR